MPLSHEHLKPKILAKIKIYILTRAELLCSLCYEIPCTLKFPKPIKIPFWKCWKFDIPSWRFHIQILFFSPRRIQERNILPCLPGLGRAARSQTLPDLPSGVPPLPFFNRPPTNAEALPDIVEDVVEDLEDELCILITRLVRKYSRRQIQQHCPAKPPSCNPKLFSKCQYTSLAKYSPEGFRNCNFGATKAEKSVWCIGRTQIWWS